MLVTWATGTVKGNPFAFPGGPYDSTVLNDTHHPHERVPVGTEVSCSVHLFCLSERAGSRSAAKAAELFDRASQQAIAAQELDSHGVGGTSLTSGPTSEEMRQTSEESFKLAKLADVIGKRSPRPLSCSSNGWKNVSELSDPLRFNSCSTLRSLDGGHPGRDLAARRICCPDLQSAVRYEHAYRPRSRVHSNSRDVSPVDAPPVGRPGLERSGVHHRPESRHQ